MDESSTTPIGNPSPNSPSNKAKQPTIRTSNQVIKTPIFSLTRNYLTSQKHVEAERNKLRSEKEELFREMKQLLRTKQQDKEELESLRVENSRIKSFQKAAAVAASATSSSSITTPTTTHHALHQVTNFLLRLC